MKDNLFAMLIENESRFKRRDVFLFRNDENDTYDTLDWHTFILQSRKVSRALISLGFGERNNIGIFSDNRPEWVIADTGVIASKNVVVPFYSTLSLLFTA